MIALRTDGGNFRFDPAGLVVEPGSSVPWLNMGDFHTTTAFHPANDNLVPGRLPLRIPEGAEPWHSGMLGLTGGTEFTYAFKVEGVYDYFCQPHYMFGMVGRIIAGRPHAGPGTKPMAGLPEIVREKMPAMDRVTGVGRRPNEWSSRINGVLYLLAHGRDAVPSSAALHRALRADAELTEQSREAGNTDAILTATSRFVQAVRDGVDYERLVVLADGVKTELARLVD